MDTPAPDAEVEAYRARWHSHARREVWRWRMIPDECPACGQRIGHWSGGVPGGPDPCPLIPLNVPLEEVRPNCVTVQRHWIGDAIRAVCDAKGK